MVWASSWDSSGCTTSTMIPPRCCAWTMFSAQTHYGKCKHLAECHSQGYCLSPLLALHLHGADQAPKHNLPQKRKKKNTASCHFQAGSLHRQGIAKKISKDLWCKLVAGISFSPANDFLSRAPYYKSSASSVQWLKSYH